MKRGRLRRGQRHDILRRGRIDFHGTRRASTHKGRALGTHSNMQILESGTSGMAEELVLRDWSRCQTSAARTTTPGINQTVIPFLANGVLFRGFLVIAIGGLLAWGPPLAGADDEALIFTPPGFDRPGMPAKATGADVGHVEVVVLDPATGKPTPCRINVVGPDGNFYQPAENPLSLYSLTGEWPKQGKGNRPGKGPFRYFGRFFYSAGSTTVDVPTGRSASKSGKASSSVRSSRRSRSRPGGPRRVTLTLARAATPTEIGYDSGDTHLHLPRTTQADDDAIFTLLAAEDIHYGFTLGYNDPPGPYKAVRAALEYPQLQGLGARSAASRGGYHMVSGQEYRELHVWSLESLLSR